MISEYSDETASTSVVEDSLNISFENITYTVRNGILARGRKTVLNNMSGSFNAGELTVIMGQSGAGKSSLMDILAGYTKPTSGTLYVNGRLRNENIFRKRSRYILQNDTVQNMLTVKESLKFAAELKLGKYISKEKKQKRVDEVITSLGLRKSQNTKVANLSGGQKKRVAIGLELISDPTVMFLDEPISGLDSSISKQIVYLLHLLARQGRTVIVTMHQPSVTLLALVDRLYAIVGGRCAYMGSVPHLLPYLNKLDLLCPPYHDPVDFLIEICVENANKLVESSQNGKNNDWTTIPSSEADSIKLNQNLLRLTELAEEVSLTSLPTYKEDPASKILLSLKSSHSTSFWTQFATLTRRSLLIIWRDPSFTAMMVAIHCVMALFIGTLYFNIADDAQYMRDTYNFLYFSLMFLMFTAFSGVTIYFPDQIPLVRREHFNQWYMTGAYFLSVLSSTLPTQTVSSMTYSCIVYWMTGQPMELYRFLSFCWMLLIVSYVALCLGLLNGSLLNVKNGVIFGPFFIMPFTIFSGFFLRYSDAPYLMRWMFHVSFLKHGLVGLMISIFGMDRPKFLCSKLYCHYRYPMQFMQDMGVKGELFSLANVALFFIGLIVAVVSFIILKIRLRHKW